MNKLMKYLFLSLTILLTLTLIAEETTKSVKNTPPPANDSSKPSASGKSSSELKDSLLALQKKYRKENLGEKEAYTPIAQLDPSFTVKGISYSRRAAHNGKGDVLDVQINIENNEAAPAAQEPAKDTASKEKDKGRDYSIYVFAFHETKIPIMNSLAHPPIWRANDPNKENTTIDYSVLSPERITPKDVWGEEELKLRKEISEAEKKKGFTYTVGEPSLSDYMLYLTKKPEKALPFKLYYESVNPDKETVTNYKSSPEAELKGDMNDSGTKSHTYTIFNAKYKTTVTTHHYTEHRNKFFFFNRVAVLIFDANKTLVYRNITDIGKRREHK